MAMEPVPPLHATTTGGLICSSDFRASQAGVQMLRAGGTCVDAAVAAAAVLNVVEPFNSHLGGDAFVLHWSARDRKVTALNGSGAAPAAARLADFAEKGIPLRGLRAATVPGEVHAWLTAHARWGRLGLPKVLAPAIAHAEEGFEVSPALAYALENMPDCHDQPNFRQQFLSAGELPRSGQVVRQPNVAKALYLIAKDGTDAYYTGPIARAIVALSQSLGGWFEMEDLAAHRTRVQEPIGYDFGPWRVLEQPAPSQGIIVLQCLAMAGHLDILGRDIADPARAHLMIEAIKAAYADRFGWWGDPESGRLPIKRMLSDEYVAERVKLIDSNRAQVYEAGRLGPGGDTTYFCVVDAEGNAVSWIQSVFHSFGCGVVEPTYGIVLNNRMNGFSTEKGHVNAVQAGKRPVHTLNSWMVLKDGQPVFLGGTPGAFSQVQWNFQVLLSLLDLGMPLEQAMAAPRWAWQEGLRVNIEADFNEEAQQYLKARGHGLQVVPSRSAGRVQLIRLDRATGQREGCGDPRIRSCVLQS